MAVSCSSASSRSTPAMNTKGKRLPHLVIKLSRHCRRHGGHTIGDGRSSGGSPCYLARSLRKTENGTRRMDVEDPTYEVNEADNCLVN